MFSAGVWLLVPGDPTEQYRGTHLANCLSHLLSILIFFGPLSGALGGRGVEATGRPYCGYVCGKVGRRADSERAVLGVTVLRLR